MFLQSLSRLWRQLPLHKGAFDREHGVAQTCRGRRRGVPQTAPNPRRCHPRARCFFSGFFATLENDNEKKHRSEGSRRGFSLNLTILSQGSLLLDANRCGNRRANWCVGALFWAQQYSSFQYSTFFRVCKYKIIFFNFKQKTFDGAHFIWYNNMNFYNLI